MKVVSLGRKMVCEKKTISNFLVRLGLVLLAGCLLVPISLVTMFGHYYAAPLQTLNLLLSFGSTSSVLLKGEKTGSPHSGISGESMAISMNKGKPLCDFSSPRSDVCEMEGDVRILAANSTVLFLHPSASHRSWHVKPHPRKNDHHALAGVTEMSVSSSSLAAHAPRCTAVHAAPAIVFSTGGYAGNLFHDFTDVLVPLFATARRFDGDVHLLVRELHPWWIHRYRPLLRRLSRHDVVDMSKESTPSTVLCYPHVIVGLDFHKEMSVDPARTAGRYSTADFARLVRRAYGLERDTAVRLTSDTAGKKRPRLLVISRKATRTFTNVGAIAETAAVLGYEAVVAEAEPRSDLAAFARLVNSCDVLMGVHGAGLANLVFLPAKGVVVQVVPLGGLEETAREDFGVAAVEMGLGYVQYIIGEEESSLVGRYPREHRVLRDPASVRREGWPALRAAYLVGQNVTLDVGRFRGTLLRALELLHY